MTTRTDTERLDFLSETFGHALVHNRHRDQWAVIPRSYESDREGRPDPYGSDRYQVFWEAEELMWAPDVRAAIDRYMDEE